MSHPKDQLSTPPARRVGRWHRIYRRGHRGLLLGGRETVTRPRAFRWRSRADSNSYTNRLSCEDPKQDNDYLAALLKLRSGTLAAPVDRLVCQWGRYCTHTPITHAPDPPHPSTSLTWPVDTTHVPNPSTQQYSSTIHHTHPCTT